jgi:DNA-binding XRE family transcriptional regulator
LGRVIADYRWANRVGVRELAKEVGVSHATMSRIENGENCDAATLVKVLVWLFAEGDHRRRETVSR